MIEGSDSILEEGFEYLLIKKKSKNFELKVLLNTDFLYGWWFDDKWIL